MAARPAYHAEEGFCVEVWGVVVGGEVRGRETAPVVWGDGGRFGFVALFGLYMKLISCIYS